MTDYLDILVKSTAKGLKVDESDVVVVWFTKTLQNAKGIFVIKGKAGIVETTYNGNEDVSYVCVYGKEMQVNVTLS